MQKRLMRKQVTAGSSAAGGLYQTRPQQQGTPPYQKLHPGDIKI